MQVPAPMNPCLLATLLALAPFAAADAQSLFGGGETHQRVGEGSVSLGFHTSSGEGTFSDDGQVFPAGDVDTRAAILGLSYRFAERWAVEARLPYVRRRHIGFLSHNPALLRPQRPNLPVVDDGDWHGGLQDFALTLRYDAIDDAMLVRPFLSLGIPTRNYPFFGNSAIGTRLHRAQLGVELVRPIGLSDFYWRGQYGYEVIERSFERVNTNAHHLELELGWHAGERLRLRAFVSDRNGKGLGGDADYAGRTNLRWYHHDQNVLHNATIAGLGGEYRLGERYSLSLVALRLIDGESVHNIRFASTLELAWHFGPRHGG
jgi:hypothetical protein